MRVAKFIALFALISVFVLLVAHLLYTFSFRAVEQFPADTQLEHMVNKTALVIVAHDDEASTFAGTIAYLRSKGWKVDFLCFYKRENAEIEALRKSEALQAGRIQQLRNVELIDLNMQKKPLPYIAVPYSDFEEYFFIDSVEAAIAKAIVKSNPSIIFSLDDVIGGYGHSEHVLVGQLSRKMANQLNSEGKAHVEYLYHHVYPSSMANRMMADQPVYEISKKIYNCTGMPEANVQITISPFSYEKMSTIKAYASQHRNLKKFIKHYHLYPHWLYFRIFDKEFFRVIRLE
ncbi:PIG-L family deacetylase [Cytophagales bacterium LB-30]|uniref:PIG-L family deacetylase n=1 Tax=Shiella aurantiaca TaxID=3058365 RepID=A0ABT8F2E4_9BACT|nr:PIG-L family deacetylase [Shiella aurantiaca]MDN4164444.1 PIG-L family deacetylase [Shiella aurantiaca]